MILVACSDGVTCHCEATSVQYAVGHLRLFRGKRQVGEFASGQWKWAYVPSRDAAELRTRIKMDTTNSGGRERSAIRGETLTP